MTPTPPPRVVLKSTTLRDALIAGVCVVAVLGLLAFGVTQLSEKPQGNTLTGTVIAKEFTPLKEQMVEFSGRRLKGTRESEGEYLLKVRVDSAGGRVFDVPVTETIYGLKNVGDSLRFLKPKTEQ